MCLGWVYGWSLGVLVLRAWDGAQEEAGHFANASSAVHSPRTLVPHPQRPGLGQEIDVELGLGGSLVSGKQ